MTWAAAVPVHIHHQNNDTSCGEGRAWNAWRDVGSSISSAGRGESLNLVHEADVGLAELRHLNLQRDLPGTDDGWVRAVHEDEADRFRPFSYRSRSGRRSRTAGSDRGTRSRPSSVGNLSAPVNWTVMLLTSAWFGVIRKVRWPLSNGTVWAKGTGRADGCAIGRSPVGQYCGHGQEWRRRRQLRVAPWPEGVASPRPVPPVRPALLSRSAKARGTIGCRRQ